MKNQKKVFSKKKSYSKEHKKKTIKLIAFSGILVALILISSIFDNFFIVFPTVNWLKLSFSYLFLWVFLEIIGVYLVFLSSFIAVFLEIWFFHFSFVPFIGYLAKFLAYTIFIFTSFYILKFLNNFKKKYLKMSILLILLVLDTIFIALILTFLNYILFIPIYRQQFPDVINTIGMKAILSYTFVFNIIQFSLIFTFGYILFFSHFQKVLHNLKKSTYNLK
ncbi:hypothetical protein JTY60_02745 [symbiont of Argiope bruennichi]|uniref:hypothetical protein n=1 Tax=symbiont of Argiope bruennichi TaxID=2810479 RepID=UPI003DA28E58